MTSRKAYPYRKPLHSPLYSPQILRKYETLCLNNITKVIYNYFALGINACHQTGICKMTQERIRNDIVCNSSYEI